MSQQRVPIEVVTVIQPLDADEISDTSEYYSLTEATDLLANVAKLARRNHGATSVERADSNCVVYVQTNGTRVTSYIREDVTRYAP